MPGLIGVIVTVPEGVLPHGVQSEPGAFPRTPFRDKIEDVWRADDSAVDDGEAEIQVQVRGWYYDVSKLEFTG